MKKFLMILSVVSLLTLQACGSDGGSNGCERYASKFSCEYVERQATYEVWYWKDVGKGNERDERLVGMVTGLANCRDTAIYAHRAEMEYRKRNWTNWSDSDDNWSERSYICGLIKDGSRKEKHRY